MIRFSAFLVAAAVGLLVAGVVTSKLVLVYAAIGVSGVALLALGIGTLVKRGELFGQPRSTGTAAGSGPAEPARPEEAGAVLKPAQSATQTPPWEASVPASPGWSVAAARPADTQPRATGAAPWESGIRPPGERPPDPRRPADVNRPPAAFTPRPPADAPAPAPGAWEWRQDAPATQPLPRAVSVPAPASPAVDPDPPTVTFAAAPPATADTVPAEPPATPQAPETTQAPEAAAEAPPEAPGDERSETQERPDTHEPTAEIPPSADDERPAEDEPSPQAQDEAGEQAPGQQTQQLPVPAAPEPAALDLEREVTVIPGVPRYHNAQCLLIRFMDEDDLDKMTLGAAQKAGCTPCRACLPDQPEASV